MHRMIAITAHPDFIFTGCAFTSRVPAVRNLGWQKAERRMAMQVRQVMSKNVRTVSPDDTIQKAASLMNDVDCGCLPVAENDRLAGIITDRDIALRAVARGKAPDQCKVREVMSPESSMYSRMRKPNPFRKT